MKLIELLFLKFYIVSHAKTNLYKKLVGRVAAQARNNSWVVTITLGSF